MITELENSVERNVYIHYTLQNCLEHVHFGYHICNQLQKNSKMLLKKKKESVA